MVRQYAAAYGTTRQQLDFAWFLDGHEKRGEATWETEAVLRASHLRAKWDVAQQ